MTYSGPTTLGSSATTNYLQAQLRTPETELPYGNKLLDQVDPCVQAVPEWLPALRTWKRFRVAKNNLQASRRNFHRVTLSTLFRCLTTTVVATINDKGISQSSHDECWPPSQTTMHPRPGRPSAPRRSQGNPESHPLRPSPERGRSSLTFRGSTKTPHRGMRRRTRSVKVSKTKEGRTGAR